MIAVLIDNIVIVVRNMSGKYCKLVLEKLEAEKAINPTTRKIVLDAFNDMWREIEQRLNLLKYP